MSEELRYSSHLSPTNSLSASRHSILSDPKSLINRLIKSIRSCIGELPNVGIILNSIGKATPFYITPRVRMFMFFTPTFQLVLSRTSLYGPSCGRRLKINLAIKSVSCEYSETKRCIRRSDDSVFALQSKPHASFSKHTVCTLHNELINMPKNLIRARFILSPKYSFNVFDKTVTLFSTLIFTVGKGIGSAIPKY